MKTDLQNTILQKVQEKKTMEYHDLIESVKKTLGKSAVKDRKTKPEYVITRTIKTLVENGYLSSVKSERSTFLRLTPKGRQKSRSVRFENPYPMNMSWDGKWRIVILDVSEKDKEMRNALRYILKKANFICLKNSVWISPFPLEHMLTSMKEDLKLTNEIIIFVTDTLDPLTEKYLRDNFGK